MLLISALQLLAETSSPNKTEGTLCLAIEEPELYQHPIQALTFARVLRILGEDNDSGIQIMYDTHSPYFLEPQHYDQIYRFIRKHGKIQQSNYTMWWRKKSTKSLGHQDKID